MAIECDPRQPGALLLYALGAVALLASYLVLALLDGLKRSRPGQAWTSLFSDAVSALDFLFGLLRAVLECIVLLF